jgi:acetyltransferase
MQSSAVETITPPETRWDTTLVTRGGVILIVRAVWPTDEPILVDLFENVSSADLRFRFLSGLRHIDAARIQQMIEVDYRTSITFLAFAEKRPIATAVLATLPDGVTAELAVSVRSDSKNRGIGWTLLQHLLRFAEANGIAKVESIESRESNETLKLERDAGFGIHTCVDDLSDVIASKSLAMD